MIGALSAVFSASPNRVLPGGQPAPQGAQAAKPQPVNSPAVEVSISPQGKKAAGLLASLPPMSIDPARHIERAESQLKQIMAELGIPASTSVKIHSKGDGSFRLTADHPKAAELETMINNGAARELRNSLIGAHNGAVLQRTSRAMSMAMKGLAQNPAMGDRYYAWVKGIVDEAMAMGFAFSYSDKGMSGTLLKPGNVPIGTTEGLDLPS